MLTFPVKNITLDSSGEVYVKYPLGNVKYVNKQNWKLSNNHGAVFDFLERNKNHDLVILKAGNEFAHPYSNVTGNADEIYHKLHSYQQPYVIGYNDHVYRYVDDKGFIWGRYHITNPRAKEYYRYISEHPRENQEIPFHSSIMLVTSPGEDLTNIQNGKVIHNAIVSEPQWGFESQMRGICVGNDNSCKEFLLAAGGVCCQDTTKKIQDLFESFNTYILIAGNDKSMSEKPKPEGEEGGGEGGKLAPTSGKLEINKAPIDWRQEIKNSVDEAIKNNMPKAQEIKQEDMDTIKADTSNKPTEDMIPKSEVTRMINEVTSKYDTAINELKTTVQSQNSILEQVSIKERQNNIGQVLLQYQDFFRKDGKVDVAQFDETLSYWSGKDAKEEDIKEDIKHSFEIAKNYITNLAQQTESVPEKKQESEPDTRSKRERITDEVENQKMNLQNQGVTVKAGNTEDLESKYQAILSKKGNNERIVNSNERIY